MKHLAVKIGTESKETDKIFGNIKNLVDLQLKKSIPILTIGIPETITEDSLVELFKFYLKKDYLNKNKIKLTILGKWYNLSSSLRDAVKELIDETRDYDKYFLNFTINYDGHEEIVDACKLLCRQVNAGKLSIDKIDSSSIKNNIYSSYFIAPEQIAITGKNQKTAGFMLWDSVYSKLLFVEKDFAELTQKDIEKLAN
jgi:undecaprenyl diphosphate synthase